MDEPVIYNRKLHPHFEEGGGEGYIVFALPIIPFVRNKYFRHIFLRKLLMTATWFFCVQSYLVVP